jgi:membrane protein required for colicin V production
MNTVDIIIGIVLLIGLYKGYLNGFFIELASLIALIAAIYGAIYFSHYAGKWLREQFNWDDIYITLGSFIITFLIIIITITYVGKLLTKVINTIQLSFINKLAGAAFGLVKMGFLVSVAFMFINTAGGEFVFVKKELLDKSIIYQYLEPIAPVFLPKIIEEAGRIDRELRRNDIDDLENRQNTGQPSDTTGWLFI